MYPVSNAVKALFEAEQRQILRITGTDKNGASINITDENVMMDGFNIDRYSCNGSKLEIGTAIAAELTLKLDNRQGTFNSIVFEGTELFVEVGIADWSQSSPTVTWIPCGYFTCYEQPRTLSTITIHALDRMAKFDKVPPVPVPWKTGTGETMTTGTGEIIYFMIGLAFPATIQTIITRVCEWCGVTFTQSISSLPNYNYSVPAAPNVQQTYTLRNVIQWCAGVMGCNAWIDWTGNLRFSWYSNTASYTTTKANRFNSDLYENDIKITGVMYSNTQGETIVSGKTDYALDITGNYLAESGIAQILPNINTVVNGFTYRAFSASVINAPYLWPMDVITFTDKDNVNHTTILTNVNFGLNSTTSLAGKGQTEQANGNTVPTAATKEQAYLIEKATVISATNAVNSMTQEQIFNRLTNNGEIQGLLLYNGKVYLNASYINTGTLSADYIRGGSINGTNVTITNLNASNITGGTLSADRIGANSIGVGKLTGTISGGSNWEINLTTGSMTIGNISAANVTSGTLSADRIAANSIGVAKLTGTISGGNSWSIDLDNGTMSIGNLSAANITSGTLSADRIAANSIGVAKLTGTISGGNNWEVNLTNGTMTIGTISADKITTGTMSANRISGGTIDASDVTITNLNADNITSGTISGSKISGGTINGNTVSITNLNANNITSGPFRTSGNDVVIDVVGAIQLNGDIEVNGYASRDATIEIDGNIYNFYNGILVQNI